MYLDTDTKKNIPPRENALKILTKVENSDAYINILLDKAFSKRKNLREDKNLITEIVYGVTRKRIELDFIIDSYIPKKPEKLPTIIRQILRIGIYQLKYLDRIPNHSAVDESVKLAKKYGHPGTVKLVNALLRNFIRKTTNRMDLMLSSDELQKTSIKFSMLTSIIEKWYRDFGTAKTLSILKSIEHTSPLSIRANNLKTSRDDLISLLSNQLESDNKPQKSPLAQNGILIKKAENLLDSEYFEKGYFIFQDEAAQIISEVLDPKQDETILDACAAPGGKTTHIAQLMNNTGRIIASDIKSSKLKLLLDNCRKLHVTSVFPLCCDMQYNVFKKYIFDRILLDAPCSCTGLLRRHPELKYKISLDKIKELSQLQLDILNNISKSLKKSGIIVYSTCSLELEENEEVIEKFLEKNRSFTLTKFAKIEDRIQPNDFGFYRIFPDDFGTDGFSFALLKNIDK